MNTRELIETAPRRLSQAPAGKKIVLIYAGGLTALSLLATLLTYLLDLQIGRSGGLSGMGTRSILSALRSMLPLIQMAVAMCLTVGYRSAMLRIGRSQYASPQGLRLGFDRFWVLFRCSIIKALMMIAIAMTSLYLASMIFSFTPWARPVVELVMPLLGGLTGDPSSLVLDDALLARLGPALLPMAWIYLIVFILLAVPVSLRYRMTDYVIIDKPGMGALMALRESRMMMRGNALRLLGLDFRLWWYYLALAAATVLCYGDYLLAAFGAALPMSGEAAYYLFYVLYLGAQFAIYYFLCNRIEVTYALAYEELRPREENPGVVLGNIFQM